MLSDRLGQAPEGKPVASVTADGAYDTRGCRDAIANRGADAVIPPGKRQALEEGQSRCRNEERSSTRHQAAGTDDLAKMERISSSKLRRDKDELHEAVRPEAHGRDFDNLTAELQVRVAILNRFTALGIPVTKSVV